MDPQRNIKFAGADANILGEVVKVGDLASDFHAHTQDWRYVSVFEETAGKVRILAAVPSLETGVCDRETRRFNTEAADLSQEIAIITISADLPFTQKKWCGAAGIDQVLVVSDHKEMDFGQKYGCLIEQPRLLTLAVFVVDRKGIIQYAAYMNALGDEPDYEAVLNAAKAALNSGG